MEISIIMPVYNETGRLRRSIDSVIKQTFADWELIMIDDGSTDDILQYCTDYLKKDKRIRLYHQKHAGQAVARNRGLSLAKGKYIAFADADDYMHPQMLEQLYRDIMSTDVKIAVGAFASGKKLSAMHRYEYHEPEIKDVSKDSVSVEAAVWKDNVYLWNKLFDRSLFEKVRFANGRFYEDTAMMHLLFDLAKQVSYNSNVLYYYCYNPYGTVQTFDEKKIADCLWAHEQRIKFYSHKKYENDLNHVTHAFLYKAYELYDKRICDTGEERQKIRRNIRKQVYRVFNTYDLERYLPLHGKIRYYAFIRYPSVFESDLLLRQTGRDIISGIYQFCGKGKGGLHQ